MRKARPQQQESEPVPPVAVGADVVSPAASEAHTPAGVNLAEKLKDLVRLAREQGYLTHEDVSEALPPRWPHRRTWTNPDQTPQPGN